MKFTPLPASAPLVLAVVATICPALPSQSRFVWTQVQTAAKPLPRKDHAMVYDAVRGVTLLFGGENQGAYYNDTWTYDGTNWQRHTPPVEPLPRAYHSMAYDPVRERVVLAGGYNGSNLDDTWEWDGLTWTRVASGVTGIQGDGAAAFDPVLGGVLYTAGTFNMIWDGERWTYLTVAIPSGASRNSAVYDASTGGILSISGRYTRRFRRSVGWQPLILGGSFSLRDIAIAHDPFRGRTVFYGGSGSVGGSSGSGYRYTWQWDGNGWQELNVVGPPGLSDAAMTFDLTRRVFVLFGGDPNGSSTNLDETWELAEIVQAASYQTFGQGCSGPSGLEPVLAPDPVLGVKPILGGSFTVRVDRAPAGQAAFGILGGSNQTYAGVPLPIELSAFRMPGCHLHVSLDAVVTLADVSPTGVARWTLPIPDLQSLLGQVFYQQVAVIDVGGAQPTLLWTNAGAGTIGYP